MTTLTSTNNTSSASFPLWMERRVLWRQCAVECPQASVLRKAQVLLDVGPLSLCAADDIAKVAGLSRPRKSGPPAPLSLVNMSTFTSPLTPHSAQPTSGKTAKEAANLEKLQKEYGRLATNVKLNQEVILQLRKMIGVEPSKDLWLVSR